MKGKLFQIFAASQLNNLKAKAKTKFYHTHTHVSHSHLEQDLFGNFAKDNV